MQKDYILILIVDFIISSFVQRYVRIYFWLYNYFQWPKAKLSEWEKSSWKHKSYIIARNSGEVLSSVTSRKFSMLD